MALNSVSLTTTELWLRWRYAKTAVFAAAASVNNNGVIVATAAAAFFHSAFIVFYFSLFHSFLSRIHFLQFHFGLINVHLIIFHGAVACFFLFERLSTTFYVCVVAAAVAEALN